MATGILLRRGAVLRQFLGIVDIAPNHHRSAERGLMGAPKHA